MLGHDPLAHPERLIRRVYAYAAYRLGDGPEAEDVTSETFERAVRYRSSYDRSKGEPVGWLLGIARRCADAALAARVEGFGEVPDSAAHGDLEQDAVRRLTLAAALAKLGDRDRELLALRYGADLTAERIGTLLDMRTNAVEVGLHRALERLRPFLDPSERVERTVRVEPFPAISRTGTPEPLSGERA